MLCRSVVSGAPACGVLRPQLADGGLGVPKGQRPDRERDHEVAALRASDGDGAVRRLAETANDCRCRSTGDAT